MSDTPVEYRGPVHKEAPAIEKVFAAQGVQAMAFPVENVPAGQMRGLLMRGWGQTARVGRQKECERGEQEEGRQTWRESERVPTTHSFQLDTPKASPILQDNTDPQGSRLYCSPLSLRGTSNPAGSCHCTSNRPAAGWHRICPRRMGWG